MRGLKAAIVGMGLVIVAMLATIVVTLVHRLGTGAVGQPPVASSGLLDEPAGTRIAAIAGVGDRLALLLQGGGGDRVVLLDAGGRVAARVGLRR